MHTHCSLRSTCTILGRGETTLISGEEEVDIGAGHGEVEEEAASEQRTFDCFQVAAGLDH